VPHHGAKRDAIVQRTVRTQARMPTKGTEGALQLPTFAICGSKYIESVHVAPRSHHARSDARTHALAQQEREIKLQAIVGDDNDVLVWLHVDGHLLLIFRIVLGIKNTEGGMSQKGIEPQESFRKAWSRQKLRGRNAMHGRMIDAFILTWVHDSGKCEAATFDQSAYLDYLPSEDIQTVGLEVHVNDEAIANLDRLHTKQHRVE
jgi:hypothetical protein